MVQPAHRAFLHSFLSDMSTTRAITVTNSHNVLQTAMASQDTSRISFEGESMYREGPGSRAASELSAAPAVALLRVSCYITLYRQPDEEDPLCS